MFVITNFSDVAQMLKKCIIRMVYEFLNGVEYNVYAKSNKIKTTCTFENSQISQQAIEQYMHDYR